MLDLQIGPKFSDSVPSANSICHCGNTATQNRPACELRSCYCPVQYCDSDSCDEMIPLCGDCYEEETATYPAMLLCSICGQWESEDRFDDGVCCQCEERERAGEAVTRSLHGGHSQKLSEMDIPDPRDLRVHHLDGKHRSYKLPWYALGNVRL